MKVTPSIPTPFGAPATTEAPGTSHLRSDGSVSFGLGGGSSFDTQGRLTTSLGGNMGLRSDGVLVTQIGNMNIGSDGSVTMNWS